jgi:hypothetical protein
MIISPREYKKCIVCGEDIRLAAQKCTKCSSYQDWRRHVITWSGLGTAILALIPFWTAALALKELAFPGLAKVELKISECSKDRIWLHIKNKVGVPAFVSSPNLLYVHDNFQSKFEFDFEDNDHIHVVKPNEINTLKLTTSAESANFPTKSISQNCFLIVQVFVDANANPMEEKCACPTT